MVELGAGDGSFTRKLLEKSISEGEVTGLDFQAAPLAFGGSWKSGDLFQSLPTVSGETVIANLILHHFENDRLRELGGLLENRKRLIFVEPWRSKLSLAEGGLLFPLVNDVTRHDMMISIHAGFLPGELPALLDPEGRWNWKEEVSLLGGIRVLGWRE